MLDRIRTAWNTLTDANDKRLLLTGPLPLWMQDVFERAAEETGLPVSAVIFSALDHAARALIEGQREEEAPLHGEFR
jgi:uncharacterized protein YbjT (DUF2867 family)